MIDMQVLERGLDQAHEQIAQGNDPFNNVAGLLESVELALGIRDCARCVEAGEAGDAAQAARAEAARAAKAMAW